MSREPETPGAEVVVPLPLLVDGALPWALRGDRRIFWWTAVPLAAASSIGAVLAIRVSMVGQSDPFAGCGGLLMLAAFYPLAALLWLFAISAMTVSACERVRGRPIEPGQALAWVLAPRVGATLLLAAVAVVAAGLFSFFVLFLGGLVVLLLFAFVVPVMLDQGSRGLTALATSASLAWRNPSGRLLEWPMVKLLALLLLQFVMGAALQILVSLPYQVFVQVVSLREVMAGQLPDPVSVLGPLVWIQVPIQFLASMVQSWVVYYVTFALAMLYADLQARRTADDLAAAIEESLHRPAATGEEPA